MSLLAIALLCAEAYWGGHPYSSMGNLLWSYSSKAAAYVLVVYFVGRLRQKEVARVYIPPRAGG